MTNPACTPFFLEGSRGKLFAVHHRPSAHVPCRGQVLCVQPFNEEMNRCRSMVTLLARRLAASGWGTLVVDPHGTGDSAGDFEDARWDVWLDDLARAGRWLDAQPGERRVVWGIRLGAILAARVLASSGRSGTALMLWQPVVDGKMHLTQFLRVKMAAQLDRADAPKETTATMRTALAGGRSVEVAGYMLHPELTSAIDAARLADHVPPAGTPVAWFEGAIGDPPGLPPASTNFLQRWPGPDAVPHTQAYAGPAFWQVHERCTAVDLVDRSAQWLDGLPVGATGAGR